MTSNSGRRSDSSARSSTRKKVHVGTGTRSRKASAHPKVQPGSKTRTVGDSSTQGGAAGSRGVRTSAGGARGSRSTPNVKRLERDSRRALVRRRLRLRVAAVIGVVVGVWALWAGVSGSQLFEIRDIVVTGNSRVSSDEVVRIAAIAEDETLLRLDAESVVQRLKGNPWIADARIARRVPSSVRITIDERVASAVVDTGSTFWFVDGNARVLGESVPSSATVLPVIRDIPDFVAEPGKTNESRTLRNALSVLAGISADLRGTVRTVSAPSVNETTLLTAAGIEVTVGEATQLAEKSALVADILAERSTGVVFIDVRSIERPISRGVGD